MSTATICSWNVNGLRATIKAGHFGQWLETTRPDVAGLQEVKATPDQVPDEPWTALGYRCWWHPAQRAGYSGAILLSKQEPLDVRIGLGLEQFDSEGRVIQADFPEYTVITAYFPNAGRGIERMEYKLAFFAAFLDHVNGLRSAGRNVVFMGDFNVAHQVIDVARPDEALKGTGFLPEERAWLDKLYASGWTDVYRSLYPEAGDEGYTWWSNRGAAYAKNVGWRIDLHVATAGIACAARASAIYKEHKFSDHAPLTVDYECRSLG